MPHFPLSVPPIIDVGRHSPRATAKISATEPDLLVLVRTGSGWLVKSRLVPKLMAEFLFAVSPTRPARFSAFSEFWGQTHFTV